MSEQTPRWHAAALTGLVAIAFFTAVAGLLPGRAGAVAAVVAVAVVTAAPVMRLVLVVTTWHRHADAAFLAAAVAVVTLIGLTAVLA